VVLEDEARGLLRWRGWRGAREELGRAVYNTLIPAGVTADYLAYTRWRFTQRIFSSALAVLSTQSMLQAVGVGAKRSLPAAAAVNWVLKDGLGRLGKLATSAQFSQAFDSELKRFRFSASIFFNASSALEMATPFWPPHFLLLASIANVGKSMASASALAVTPAFHRSFSNGDNMADISAKAQAQHVIADNLGLALALLISGTAKARQVAGVPLAPLVAWPFLVAADLFSNYRELKAVQLRTLNMQRSEIGAHFFLRHGRAPSTLQASAEENIVRLRSGRDRGWPLEVVPLHRCAGSPAELAALLRRHRRDGYVLAGTPENRDGRAGRRGTLYLSLRSDATDAELAQAVLQAAHFRETAAEGAAEPLGAEAVGAALRESLQAARGAAPGFGASLRERGWQVNGRKLTHTCPDTFTLAENWEAELPRR